MSKPLDLAEIRKQYEYVKTQGGWSFCMLNENFEALLALAERMCADPTSPEGVALAINITKGMDNCDNLRAFLDNRLKGNT